MNYRIKMNMNISMKDKESFRELTISSNKLSVPISGKTLDYLKENYKKNIICIEPIESKKNIQEIHIPKIASNKNISEKEKEKEKEKENITLKKSEDNLIILDDFDISDDEINSIIKMEEDIDRIYISNEDGKECTDDNIESLEINLPEQKFGIEPSVKLDIKTLNKNSNIKNNNLDENLNVKINTEILDDSDNEINLDFLCDDLEEESTVELLNEELNTEHSAVIAKDLNNKLDIDLNESPDNSDNNELEIDSLLGFFDED